MGSFIFRSGDRANNLVEFLMLCIQKPQDAYWHLSEGHFEPWLQDSGYGHIADIALDVRSAQLSEKKALFRFLAEAGIVHPELLVPRSFYFVDPALSTKQPPIGAKIISEDGEGDYEYLDDALSNAEDGEIIFLQPGDFFLDKGRTFTKSITLIGAGIEHTSISAYEVEDYVLKYEGTGPLRLQDLTIYLDMDDAQCRDVFIQTCGSSQIERCQFKGASSTSILFGGGLEINGNASSSIRDCLFQLNGFGLIVKEQASAEIQGCIGQLNQHSGLLLQSSMGKTFQNSFNFNRMHGILVQKEAKPLLENNTCSANQGSGVVFCNNAGGKVIENSCDENNFDGISVNDSANPTLLENGCYWNRNCGVSYHGNSTGTAQKNRCQGNAYHGIYLTDEANPTLEQNTCQDNGDCGIAYFKTSSGSAKTNIISQTGEGYAIYIDEIANPTLLNNEIVGIVVNKHEQKQKELQKKSEEAHQRAAERYEERFKNANFESLPYNNRKYDFNFKYNLPTREYSKQEIRRHLPEQEKAERDNSFYSAIYSMSHLLEKCEVLVKKIKTQFGEAQQLLSSAEEDFDCHSFASFWQNIEKAGYSLDQIAFMIYALERFQKRYLDTVPRLEKQYNISNPGQNFPDFFFFECVPDVSGLAQKYERLLRQGLTNYEFASILEMIKTQKSIIAGFKSINQGIQAVGARLEDSLSILQQQMEVSARNSRLQFLAQYYNLSK